MNGPAAVGSPMNGRRGIRPEPGRVEVAAVEARPIEAIEIAMPVSDDDRIIAVEITEPVMEKVVVVVEEEAVVEEVIVEEEPVGDDHG